MLGCLPSELPKKHPKMSLADKLFMARYGHEKRVRQAEIIAQMFKSGGGTWQRE